jgi:hypothetical protein
MFPGCIDVKIYKVKEKLYEKENEKENTFIFKEKEKDD